MIYLIIGSVLIIAGAVLWYLRMQEKAPEGEEASFDDVEDELPEITEEIVEDEPFSVSGEIISITLLAEAERPYSGYELLQSLLAHGLRYGKMQIFHRHASGNGRGQVRFSLAAATNEGTFDLNRMGVTQCRGLMLFMQLDSEQDLLANFDLMLETAESLREELGGKLLDGQYQLLNNNSLAALRARVAGTMPEAVV